MTNFIPSWGALALTGIAVAAIVDRPARAQESPQAATAGQSTDPAATKSPTLPESDTQLQDIIVTAERSPRTIQRTSIAITAVDGADLKESGVADLVNAVDQVPAVQVQKSNTGSTFYIRGIGARGTGSSPISVFEDGIYQRQSEVIGASFTDIDRIEVLRGPQGTLYGRNANGGTVNIITNDPVLAQFGGTLSMQGGNYDTARLEGAMNLPVSDTLALRVAGSFNRHDGYLSNGLVDQQDLIGRAKLLWEPTDDLRVLLTYETLNSDANGPGNVLLSDTTRGKFDAPDYSTLRTIPAGTAIYCSPNCTGVFKLDNKSYRGEVDYRTRFGTATFLGGIQRFERTYAQPFSGLWEIDTQPLDQETYEVRLAADPGARVQWVVGAYMLDEDLSGEQKYNYTFGAHTLYAVNVQKSRAGFGQLTIPLADRFRLTGGLRYTKDSFRYREDAGTVDGATGVVGSLLTAGTYQSGSYDKFTFKGGAEADLGSRSLLYAQYSTGFRSGGIDASGGLYNPEIIKAIEAGVKNRFLNNRLQINAAAYYYRYGGYQLTYYVYANGSSIPAFITSNVPGTTKVWGGEIEGSMLLTPIDRVDFSGNYQNSRFGDATIQTDPTGSTVDLTGRKLPRTPRLTTTLGYDHSFRFANGGKLVAHVDGQYKSDYDVDILTFNYSHQNAYALVNGRITYSAPGFAWTIGAYINNATNKEIVQQANTAGPVDVYGVVGDPRTYGLVLTTRF